MSLDAAAITATTPWETIILSEAPATQVWQALFTRLGHTALAATSAAALHRETVVPDRLLAESAWDLWQVFPTAAPSIVAALHQFWTAPTAGAGSAVLVLDGLSLRELPHLVNGAVKRGITPTQVSVAGSPIPSETNMFAAALGLPQRSTLFNNQAPASFRFGGPDVYTDVLDGPFGDCVARIVPRPRLFLWHKWPDDPLIHNHAEQREGDTLVAGEIKRTLGSDDFWALVNQLRQGRRLLITGDHGYATAAEFSSEVKDEASISLFAGIFGAKRAIREDDGHPWPRRQLPPPVLRFTDTGGTWLVVMGQRKWKVRGGFPTLCHGGLSLLETCVPIVALPAL